MKIRPLKREETQKEKQKKNLIIMGIIMIGLMVFSTVGYAFFDGSFTESQKTKYKTYEFTTNGENWQTKIKISGSETIINSFYLPQDIENISMTGTLLLSDFEGKTIYFVTNNTNRERNAVSKIYSDFEGYFTRSQLACALENENTTFCSNLPIKSCDDANQNSMIIQITEITNSTAVIDYKNNCLTVSGDGADLLKTADRILFESYGIIS